MKSLSMTRYVLALTGLLCALLFVPSARAQQRDEYGDVRDIRQTVARIAYLSGDVSFARGDDPDDWQPADRNVPMTLGDRVYTGSRSRLELHVHGGDAIRLGARTDLAALNLTDDTKQFSVKIGVASFQVRRLSDSEIFEVDTPNTAVTFERPGDYRVDVDSNGNTRVSVREGSATVAAGGGQIRVETGEGIQLDGLDSPRYDIVRLAGPDGWDQWVEQRQSRFAHVRSYQYVSADVVGVDDLDEYGRWQRVPEYGWVWSPSSVDPGWVPYRVGHWIWQDPWGWSWVSAEPWGWAPYHYGRWAFVSSRWCWVPVAPSVRVAIYSPALVAFVGGGPGWSLSVSSGGGGFIGWFPLGPSDPFVPWWGIRTGVRATTVTNVAFVNRTYVTVVNRNTFVSGGVVTSAVVTDRAVISQVASAPVLRGPIPALPTAGALHVAVRTEAASTPRPPAEIVTRSVVARVAPPPAPPTFQAKLAVITENRGAPVAPATAARISVENRGRPQTVSPVKPVAPEGGRVMLAPRSAEGAAGARRPEPVTAFRGRPMATTQQPVATSPVTGSAAPSGPPAREVAPRERVAPAEPAPQAPPGRGRERQMIATPVPEPGSAAPPGERARPGSEEWRQRVQPTQPPPPGLERRRAVPPAETPAPAPPGLERRREAAPPPQQAQPPQQPAQGPPGVERRIERPTPPPEPPREGAPERRREAGPPPQAQQPPPSPQAAPERRREGGPPPQAQQPPPPTQAAPERRREGGPPPQAQQPPPPPPGENRPQIERGRPTPKPEEQKKGKKEEKKEEKEKKPTPSS